MKIKTRLVISYIAMVIIAMILSVAFPTILINLILGVSPQKMRSVNLYSAVDPKNNPKLFTQTVKLIKANPDLLQDPKFLAAREAKFKIGVFRTGIVVRKNRTFIYASKFLPRALVARLPQEGRIDELQFFNTANSNFHLTDQYDFRFKDHSWGAVFLFAGTNYNIQKFFRLWSLFINIAYFLSIIICGFLLTFLMAKTIIKPLQQLKSASEQIKEGNLNFQLTAKAKDEIGQLATAFEEMRSKLKDSIDKQLQYENSRKELISGISHDLKTPVTAIKGYVEGIMDGVADTPEKIAKYVKTIYSKAADLDQLIDELFLFSKLDLHKLPYDFEKVDLLAFLTDCLGELQFDLLKKGIILNFSTNCTAATFIIADREKLKRVIVNVISNCDKYRDDSKDATQILIKLQDEPETVTIQIRDNGLGIHAEDLPFIFDSFYRADQSRNPSTGGSGLGLAIAKKIIEGHQGQIWAESEYGVGSAIYINFKKYR